METLALRIYAESKSKITIENGTVFGKAAIMAEQLGYIKAVAVSPGHTTYIAAR